MLLAMRHESQGTGLQQMIRRSFHLEPTLTRCDDVQHQASVHRSIVRASWFLQNFSEHFLLEPVLAGEVAFPAAQVAEPFIDAEDVADVAAAALIDDRHNGQLYEVTGPRLLTFGNAIEEIAKATGREICYVPVSGSAMREYGVPEGFANPLAQIITTVLDGRNAHLSDGVRRALGRKPRDFSEYARATAATGIWGVRNVLR